MRAGSAAKRYLEAYFEPNLTRGFADVRAIDDGKAFAARVSCNRRCRMNPVTTAAAPPIRGQACPSLPQRDAALPDVPSTFPPLDIIPHRTLEPVIATPRVPPPWRGEIRQALESAMPRPAPLDPLEPGIPKSTLYGWYARYRDGGNAAPEDRRC